jgi:type II secretory pathway component PulL
MARGPGTGRILLGRRAAAMPASVSISLVGGEKHRMVWIALVTALAVLILIAVVLTWRYAHRCNAWEAKVRQQTDDMFYPAFGEVYTSEEIESMARRALAHERPEGC